MSSVEVQYLMYCNDDRFYCVVDKTDLICDETQQLAVGTKLKFFQNNKPFDGEIELISDNGDYLQQEAKRRKKEAIKKTISQNSELPQQKRVRKQKQIYTPPYTENPTKKPRKQDNSKQETKKLAALKTKLCQKHIRSLVTKANKTKNEESSDEEGKLVIDEEVDDSEQVIQNTKENKKRGRPNRISDSDSSDEDDGINEDDSGENNEKDTDDDSSLNKNDSTTEDRHESGIDDNTDNDGGGRDDEDSSRGRDEVELNQEKAEEPQLLASAPTAKMVELHNGIMCVEKVLDSALSVSNEGTHLARRLMEGVFTTYHLLHSTYSGQPPHAQGKERMNEQVDCLNNKGKQAIIDYTLLWCKEENKRVPTKAEFKKAMTQRIGEIKRQHKANQK